MGNRKSYITVRLRVLGLVQGVGFRYWTLARAAELSLGGYVRNLPDRSVEALFSGSPDAVAGMVELMRAGPCYSSVDEVKIIETEETEEPVKEFRIVR